MIFMESYQTLYRRTTSKLTSHIATTSNNIQHMVQDISIDYYMVIFVAMIAFTVGYLWFPATPGNLEDHFMGWFEWSDQGLYLESAKAIAHGNLSPSTYVYPLGYPMLAAPFIKWLPRHPFFLPNLFFSTGIALAYYASCRKLLTKVESASLTVFLIILSGFSSTKAIPGGLIWFNSLTIPWNIIPVFFAAYITTWLLIFNTADFRKLWVSSLVIALAFFARPPDVIFLGIIYLAGLLDLKTLREKVKGLVILGIPSLIVLIIMFLSKWIVFGSLISPYDAAVSDQGFNLSNLFFKFYVVFFDGTPIYGYPELMLFPQMPWLLLCIPGIFWLAQKTNNKSWLLMLAMAVCLVIYISFNAQAPSNTFNYFGYRYFTWIIPWLGLCSYLTITRSWTGIGKKKTLLGILAGVIFVLIIGWRETVVATIPSTNSRNTSDVSETYDRKSKKFVSEIDLSSPVSADGMKLVFSTPSTKNMQVANDWRFFKLVVDGREQVFIHDYTLYQVGKDVYVSFRNPINKIGQFQKAQIEYNHTAEPELETAYILQKKFKPFGFIEKMLASLKIFPDEWNISDEQAYNWGSEITMSAGGNSAPYKSKGWSVEETDFTWTEGNDALLTLKGSPVTSDLEMNMDALGLVTHNLQQPVEIKVNGRLVKTINLSGIRETYKIDIPFKYLRKDGVLFIQFHLPNAISPLELGINQDQRLLSMALFNMTLHTK
jgi:hypothetical protein